MSEITTVGLDLAKNAFQAHGADASVRAVLRRRLRRDQVLAFFSQLPPCIVAMSCCRFRGHEDKIVTKETEIGHGETEVHEGVQV